jgi:hypothetical protein
MRSLNLIAGIFAFSALAVSVGVGCSSSSNKGSGSSNDASIDTGTGTASEDGGDAETCALSDAGSLATYTLPANAPEAGVALWDCESHICASDLSTCAADTCCNALIVNALTCSNGLAADAGFSAILQCFGAVTTSTDPNAGAVAICLMGAESSCGVDAGAADAEAKDGAADGGTAVTDGATTDGAVEQ